ncbi:MAG: 5-formyltetrahydrofolate cyclo-ligase [Sphingobacteriales bacterium]|nr:5-formyltetrahydrofolate cyclo-ligase [Sphingobacteriales bacterium]
MLKKEIRKIYKDKRLQLSFSQKEKLDDLLLIQFQQLPLPYIQTLLSYWPIEEMKEVNTHHITDFVEFRNPGLAIAYPVADFATHTMKSVLTNDDTEFDLNEYQIIEPTGGEVLLNTAIDVVFIPLLAFDKNGYRVGYGKGFYDRFLATCRKDVIKIGFSYFEPVNNIKDTDANDIKMSYCITPEHIYKLPWWNT